MEFGGGDGGRVFGDEEDGVGFDCAAFHYQFGFRRGVGGGGGGSDGAGEDAGFWVEVDGFDGFGAGEHGYD